MIENSLVLPQVPELFLLPVPLSAQTPPNQVLPNLNLEIVKNLKHFAVENIRSARRFLKAVDRSIDIGTLTFFVLDEHTKQDELTEMLKPMREGHSMGVISEAGCPGIADPGALLVEEARIAGFTIRPLVGPSSILLSLMGSGFNGQNFSFLGYLPIEIERRKKQLREMVRRITVEHQTQIFIETPYRNNRLIEELTRELNGSFRLCVASELTSPTEKIIVKYLSEWVKTSYDFSKHPTIFLLSR